MAILEHLIRFSDVVTVSLNCDEVNSDQAAFETAGKTAAELVRLAKNAGVGVEIVTVDPRADERLQYIRQRQWQSGRYQAAFYRGFWPRFYPFPQA